MGDNNYFEETLVSSPNNKTNINYLQQQKQQLQIQIKQLLLNNKVLRSVINNIKLQYACSQNNKDSNQIWGLLITRNQQLQQKLNEQFVMIKEQQAQNILIKQVSKHQQKQIKQILKNYEQKIAYLRRLVQNKQTSIQKYQYIHAKQQDNYQNIVPPYNVSIHFYAEIEQYKRLLEHSKIKNQKLYLENSRLLQQIDQLQTSLGYQNKHSNTKSNRYSRRKSFSFQHQINENTGDKSQFKNKKIQQIEQTQKIANKKCDMAECSGITFRQSEIKQPITVTLSKIIHRMKIDAKMMNQKIIQLQQQNKNLLKIKQTLTASNTFYQNNRKQIQQKYKLQQQLTHNIIGTVLKRSPIFDVHKIQCNQDDTQNSVHKIISKKIQIRNQQLIQKQRLKQTLMELADSFPKNIVDVEYRRNRRSNSCIVDYIKQVQYGGTMHEQKQKRIDNDGRYQNYNDFTLMLQDDDIEYVSGRNIRNETSAKNNTKTAMFEGILDGL